VRLRAAFLGVDLFAISGDHVVDGFQRCFKGDGLVRFRPDDELLAWLEAL
jgi:hypothetical protein